MQLQSMTNAAGQQVVMADEASPSQDRPGSRAGADAAAASEATAREIPQGGGTAAAAASAAASLAAGLQPVGGPLVSSVFLTKASRDASMAMTGYCSVLSWRSLFYKASFAFLQGTISNRFSLPRSCFWSSSIVAA